MTDRLKLPLPLRSLDILAIAIVVIFTLLSLPASRANEDVESGTVFFMDYRALQEGESDGVAIIELDPEAENFGEIIQRVDLGQGVLPHHLYFNHDESRLYTSALGGAGVYEIIVEADDYGTPSIAEVVAVDTGGQIVGEDIYFTEDGSEYWVTFMGGFGGDTGGTVGVFNAENNELLEIIDAPKPENLDSDEPFIMYPHAITANEEQGYILVSSTIHFDLSTGIGNTVTLIDIDTREVLKTYLVADSPEDPSSPVEAFLVRGDYEPYALVNTMVGGDVWGAAFNEETGIYDEFTKLIEGDDVGSSWPLEFYVGPGEDPDSDDDQLLYISWAVPGVVRAYRFNNLPELEVVREYQADGGAHHMAFYTTASGREVVAIQNNLLNLSDPLPFMNAGTLTVYDLYTAELLATVDLPESEGIMPESIELASGNGHYMHH